jgi:hypothetical protein
MTENIVKIETAVIGRLPQAKGEIWEVGRRRLDLAMAELDRKGQRPEALLAVQVSGRGGGDSGRCRPIRCTACYTC